MLKIKLTEDLGKKQLEDKWNGKFLDDSCYVLWPRIGAFFERR